MLDHIENVMTKIMKDFIWDGNKRGLMRLDYTAEIREKRGLGMPNLKTRMKAIDIMWLKKYLDTPDKRPTWCWVADTLIKGDTYLDSCHDFVVVVDKNSALHYLTRSKRGLDIGFSSCAAPTSCSCPSISGVFREL